MNDDHVDKWRCRERIEKDEACRNQISRTKVVQELVFGHWQEQIENRNKSVTPRQIVGKVFHSLSGPTAQASIMEFCEDLNRRGVPPKELPELRPASNKKPDPNQQWMPLSSEDWGKK